MGLRGRSSSTCILFLLVFINVSLMEDLGRASAYINNRNISCNGTIADCFFGDEDEGREFLTFSVGGRSLLQTGNKLSYNTLQSPPVCSEPKYSNCIQQNGPNNRPCTDYNRCKRAA